MYGIIRSSFCGIYGFSFSRTLREIPTFLLCCLSFQNILRGSNVRRNWKTRKLSRDRTMMMMMHFFIHFVSKSFLVKTFWIIFIEILRNKTQIAFTLPSIGVSKNKLAHCYKLVSNLVNSLSVSELNPVINPLVHP